MRGVFKTPPTLPQSPQNPTKNTGQRPKGRSEGPARLTAIAQPLSVVSTCGAFALWVTGGAVVTWGREEDGGGEVLLLYIIYIQIYVVMFIFCIYNVYIS